MKTLTNKTSLTIIFIIIIFILLFLALKNNEQNQEKYEVIMGDCYLIANYNDIGICGDTNEIVTNLIGRSWWQWDRAGSDDPNETYDIKVVIYQGSDTEQKVRKLFPVQKAQLKDYRFINYTKIKPYFEKLQQGYSRSIRMNDPFKECFNKDISKEDQLYCALAACDNRWLQPSSDAETMMNSCRSE